MRRLVPVLLAFSLATIPLSAQAATLHGPKAAAEGVLAAEHAFATRAKEAGIATAFRDFMDEADGLSFGSGAPKRGAAAIFESLGGAKPNADQLTWEPEEIFAAKTGDMAVSWGTYVFTPAAANAKPSTGRFVTVWRKSADGAWKGLVDIGAPD